MVLVPDAWLAARMASNNCRQIDRRLQEMGEMMQDLAMLLFTVVFFGLAFLYVKACQKLR